MISSGGRLGTGQFADCQQLRATLQYLADLPKEQSVARSLGKEKGGAGFLQQYG